MACNDFPNNPVLDEIYDTGTQKYRWDGAKWVPEIPAGGGGSGGTIFEGEEPPVGAVAGDLWYACSSPDSGLYYYLQDVDSLQWVPVASAINGKDGVNGQDGAPGVDGQDGTGWITSADPNNIVNSNTGNVGVNQSAPLAKIHVKSPGNSYTDALLIEAGPRATGGGRAGIAMKWEGSAGSTEDLTLIVLTAFSQGTSATSETQVNLGGQASGMPDGQGLNQYVGFFTAPIGAFTPTGTTRCGTFGPDGGFMMGLAFSDPLSYKGPGTINVSGGYYINGTLQAAISQQQLDTVMTRVAALETQVVALGGTI